MKTNRNFLFSLALLVALIPLAACNQEGGVVDVDRNAEGDTSIQVDGEKVDENFEQAERNFDEAGRELKEGAQDLGAAMERGAEAVERQAEKVEAEVGPVVRDVLDDATVTAKVKAMLVADPEVKAFHIDVDTLDGRVTLSGKVASEDQRAEAEKLASRTEGVKEVLNLIQVAGQ